LAYRNGKKMGRVARFRLCLEDRESRRKFSQLSRTGVRFQLHIYLPTDNGPMPIAALIDGNTCAVHSDHLNTPRKLTNADGLAVGLQCLRGGQAHHSKEQVRQHEDDIESGHDEHLRHRVQPALSGAVRGEGKRPVLQLMAIFLSRPRRTRA
jgi:hypothetical protein